MEHDDSTHSYNDPQNVYNDSVYCKSTRYTELIYEFFFDYIKMFEYFNVHLYNVKIMQIKSS